MNIWITTDTHFGHKKLIEYGRPNDYEVKILKGLKVLKPGDWLIHLGDVCIGHDGDWHQRIIEPLPCRKTLIRGNHDRKTAEWYISHGWDAVCDSLQIVFQGKNIVFSHCPETPAYWYNKTRFDGYDMNIHGHTHGNNHREAGNFKCVELALENNDYKLFNLKKLIKR